MLAAYHALGDWLADKPRTTTLPDTEVPLDVINPAWEPHVRDRATATVTRAGYACCVLDALRTRLRRRDIYAPASTRWGDPRAELLTPDVWEDQRQTLCDELALDTDPASVLDQLTTALDTAWRVTAAGAPANPDLRIEHRDGRDEIVLTPLDAHEEPDSLVALRAEVEALLPEVEIADLPLEVHRWTGFLDEYTHISGTPSREPGLPETLSALLVSESCNVGLTPVTDPAYPPLTRDRLNWVGHNDLRSATHAAANTRLVDFHTGLPLAQAWGGGEMASADGMRFVIPVSTIHAAYNPRYFGRQRGSTLYSWMADTHMVFAQTLIPGTQRDSLHALDGLLANQTLIRPEMVSTDTAGASEIVFALVWAWATGGHPGWPTCPTNGSGTSTPTPTTARSPGSHATASTLGSSSRTGTKSAASPPHCEPAPSPPRRSCGPCNAALTPPASLAPSPSSAGSSRPCTYCSTAATPSTAAPSITCSTVAKPVTAWPATSSTASVDNYASTTKSGRKISSAPSGS